jgi:hypothetical protein
MCEIFISVERENHDTRHYSVSYTTVRVPVSSHLHHYTHRLLVTICPSLSLSPTLFSLPFHFPTLS